MTSPHRSGFVTTLAWLFIILAAVGTVMLAVQNLFLQLMFSPGELERLMGAQLGMDTDAPVHHFMVEHFRALMLVPLALAAMTLTAAIGLLKRRVWGYGLFMVMMVVGIVWNAIAIFLNLMIATGAGAFPGPVTRPGMFGGGFQLLVSALLVPLFGWIIVRLRAPEIRREFDGG
jgi:hypothetical protein